MGNFQACLLIYSRKKPDIVHFLYSPNDVTIVLQSGGLSSWCLKGQTLSVRGCYVCGFSLKSTFHWCCCIVFIHPAHMYRQRLVPKSVALFPLVPFSLRHLLSKVQYVLTLAYVILHLLHINCLLCILLEVWKSTHLLTT